MINNKMRIIGAVLVGIMLISLVSSYPIYVKPKTAGALQPNTAFIYEFNFTTNADCSGVLLSNRSTITTGADGIGFIDINISSLTTVPLFICEYKNNALRDTHQPPEAIFSNIYASGNVSTNNWFRGLFNWTVSSIYAIFNGAVLTLNDTLFDDNLNQTSIVNTTNTTANIEELGFVPGNHTSTTFDLYNSTWDNRYDQGLYTNDSVLHVNITYTDSIVENNSGARMYVENNQTMVFEI